MSLKELSHLWICSKINVPNVNQRILRKVNYMHFHLQFAMNVITSLASHSGCVFLLFFSYFFLLFPFVTFYLSSLVFTKKDSTLVLVLLITSFVAAFLFSFWASYFKRSIAYRAHDVKKQKILFWSCLSVLGSVFYLIYLSFET